MPSYILKAYAQILASASLFVFSIMGIIYLAGKVQRKIYKMFLIIVCLLILILSMIVILEVTSLMPRVCMQNVKKWLNWSTWETVAT
jgi:cell division protein FtsW (lipid II flippase)